jgi:GT2 family glycosyltransferase
MKILIVVLEYLEPEWQHTLKCVKDTGLPYEIVSRDGVGNMSRAYNSILLDPTWKADYLWFVSNITFKPDLPFKLAEAIEKNSWAAIHPAMAGSDHRFQWPDKFNLNPIETHFVEWTAPMVNAEIFTDEPLDEMLPYYYMDLDWCHRVKSKGWKVGVHKGEEIEHTYLRNKKEHPIGTLRKQLRNYWTPISQRYMVEKYGKDWQAKLWPK